MDLEQRIVHAVRAQDLATLTALLTSNGERVLDDAVQQFRDAQQRSLAHIAIRDDSIEVLDFALASGLDVDARCEDRDGRTPVACAVLSQHLPALRVLISYGAITSALDSDRRSLLHLLAMHSDERDLQACAGIVDVLLRSGDTQVDARDQCGNTPLHLAAVYGSPSVVAALLRHGANANALNASGSSPLHFAAATGDYTIAQQLLTAGADVNAVDALGNTPLIDAAFVSQSAVSTLFAFGDNESQGRIVTLLLESGADVNAVNREGNNALFGAVRNGFEDVVAQLSRRQAAAGFQQRNNQRETLLHVAARAQVTSVSIWETLLACCGLGSVRARDRFERTCVHIWMAWPQSLVAAVADESVEDEEHQALSSSAAASRRGSSMRAVSKLLLSIN